MTMRSTWLLVLLASGAAAFKNTSPFFLLSTSRIFDSGPESSRLASAASVTARISSVIDKCPSDAYFVVQQPGVSALDFFTQPSAPYLRQWLNSTRDRDSSAWIVPEVIGSLDANSIAKEIEDKCKATPVSVHVSSQLRRFADDLVAALTVLPRPAGSIPNEDTHPRLMTIIFNPIAADNSGRSISELNDNDSFLHAMVASLGGDKYTIFYTSTPATNPHVLEPPAYEMDSKYEAAMHEDLKRDLTGRPGNDTLHSGLPLFEKYQFLSPGIFMGLSVSIMLLLILYVGISAISSLEVSYFAFSKEMGPTAQKKQQ